MRQLRFTTMLAGLFALLVGSGAFAQASAQAAWTPSDCESCHDKALTPAYNKSAHAKADQSCAKCHNTEGWHTIIPSGFNHDLTRYPLRGMHAGVACTACSR